MDLELVEAVLKALRDYSNLAAAEVLNVSEATVRRWRANNIAIPLRTATRLSLKKYLSAAGAARATGSGAAGGREGSSEIGTGVLKSPAEIRSYLEGLGAGEDNLLRKLEVLDGIRAIITVEDTVPDWWYSLKREVKQGRL